MLTLGIFASALSLSLPAYSFPSIHRSLDFSGSTSQDFSTAYDFEGIIGLSGCSGSLIRFEDSLDTDQAIILTNGHCVKIIPPGVVLTNQKALRTVDILDSKAKRLGSITTQKLIYATMTRTDIALYQVKETYADIRTKFSVEALTLSSQQLPVGGAIEVISGYWKRGYSCAIEAMVPSLQEGDWFFEGSLRYSRPGCAVIGGTSGSPVLEAGTRKVVAINNTINESGKRCEVNNPCEVLADGGVLFEKGYGYAQETVWVYGCRNAAGVFDLNVEGCQLPKPAL